MKHLASVTKHLLILLCLFSTDLFSQRQLSVKASSSTNSKTISLNYQDVLKPDAAGEEKMNSDILRYRQTQNALFTLPVVFHIINEDPSSVTDQHVIDALKELNDGFAKTGIFSSSTGADTKIQFCLAQKDPDGGRTNGITRTTSFFSKDLNPKIEDERLKNLIQWDPTRYINIWVIKSMELEIVPQFDCGKWIRSKGAGYATMPPNTGITDGIVITGFKTILIHEMGHYLGLYHTFEGLNCKNNDCNTDGDKVCDTPPDASLFSIFSCGDAMNSCNTDTLSGFAADVPDNTSNFMDYGNENCHNQFTEGQAARMRAAIATQRAGLLQEQCAAPCVENITVNFKRNNPYPLPGSTVSFTGISSGATKFEWLVNGTVAASTTNFTYTFSNPGKYKVTLKAYNSPTCYATYTDYVIVSCGVTARFYTDKSLVASKAPLTVDSIRFINTSVNATTFKWLMRSDSGMAEQVVSTSRDLTYVFTSPATYYVKLIASNGACADTTGAMPISVIDPTPEGAIFISSAECTQDTAVNLALTICNYGYLPLPQKLPISFYDADPRTSTAKKIGSTFYLPDSVAGNCCSKLINYKLNVGRNGLNTLYAVFNDSGNTSPLKFPNTSFLEKDYSNNIAFIHNFDYKVTATPSISVLEPGDTLQLNAVAGPGITTSYVWNTPPDLSCTTCPSPILIAGSSTIKNVVATSNKGCTDTAYVDIKVPPYNDYRIAINDAQCAAADSIYVNFTVYNDFKRAVLPASLSVAFYNGNPALGNAVLLQPLFSLKDTINAKEYTFSTFIKGIGAGNIYAVVNDSGKALPVNFSNPLLAEKNYSNNISLISYKPEEVLIQPSDTTVFRKELVPLTIISPVYDPTSTRWSTVNGSTLSCADCPATIVKALDSSVVRVQTKNRFGCLLNGTAAINIFPPDMQVQITDTKCFSDNTALVTFSICMNNNYDSVFANIPVLFYDGNPESGTSRLLQPVFYTPLKQVGSCYTYTAKVTSPSTNNLYAVVNDKGTRIAAQASTVYKETNYTNNLSQAIYTPFRVSIIPSDTLIQRSTSITLTPRAEGGTLTQYLWKPGPFISCTNCATPIVTPQYTMQYQLWAKNENFCTDTASAIVRTHIAKEVFIPDAFTPNNDKLNDVLYVLSDPLATLINDFAIFNRLGQKVFQVQNVVPNNPAFGWNGKINGRDAPAGTYVYFVTMGFNDGRRQTYKGTIVLIR